MLHGQQNIKRDLYSWFEIFALHWMLYSFFWVIPRLLIFICRRFGTTCLFLVPTQHSFSPTYVLLVSTWGSLPHTACFTTQTRALPVATPYNWPRKFSSQNFPLWIPQKSRHGYSSCSHHLWRRNSVFRKSEYEIRTPGNYPQGRIQRDSHFWQDLYTATHFPSPADYHREC